MTKTVSSTAARGLGRLLLASALMGGLSSGQALAQAAATTAASANPAAPAPGDDAPSPNAMVNLIRLLVQQKVITQAAGDALMQQALAEAERAKAVQPRPPAGLAEAPPPGPGTLRVPYVPEIVKRQLKDEVRQEVMAQAKAEGWAQPDKLPAWLERFSFSGDIRLRTEYNFFANSNEGSNPGDVGVIDFAAINDGSPVDINPDTNRAGFPTLNTLEDRRNRVRLRARLNIKADITDTIYAGVRLSTGNNDSPVSTNTDFGDGFRKQSIFFDRVYLAYEGPLGRVFGGRIPNPFVSTDLVYDEDLNFDGVAASVDSSLLFDWPVKFTLTGGAFPLDVTPTNSPTNSAVKNRSRNKWLFAVQGVADWEATDQLTFQGAVAYYRFTRAQARLSSPCLTFLDNQCSSDGDRPPFQNKGNTFLPIRQIVGPAGSASFAQPQYFGLAFDYALLDVNGSVKAKLNETLSASISGNYVRNLNWRASDACRFAGLGATPFNNFRLGTLADGSPDLTSGPCGAASAGGTAAQLQSGNQGWLVKATVGYDQVRERGQWSLAGGYRYLEPDAVLDGYTDSDFHLGGTNAQGYFVTASAGLFHNIWLTGRWLSANEIYGPNFSIDVLQLDLNASF